MNTAPPLPNFPLFTNSLIESQAFDVEDSDDVMGIVKQLINGQHPGILSTLDGRGYPRARWMATLALDDFPTFYTLTAPGSRKVEEITRYKGVSWMFFNQDLSLVVTLTGTATIRRDPATLKRAWKQVRDFSHAYFLSQYQEKPGFVVIETQVERVECASPKNNLSFTVPTAQLEHPGGANADAFPSKPSATRAI